MCLVPPPASSLQPSSELLEHLQVHKAVGHNEGAASPWEADMPDPHEVLPAFMESVIHRHLHAPTLIDWLDGVYFMLVSAAGSWVCVVHAGAPQAR